MVTSINKGSCFNCGVNVDDSNWEYAGNCKLWYCDDPDCNRALRWEIQAAHEEEREEAMRQVDEDFGLY